MDDYWDMQQYTESVWKLTFASVSLRASLNVDSPISLVWEALVRIPVTEQM